MPTAAPPMSSQPRARELEPEPLDVGASSDVATTSAASLGTLESLGPGVDGAGVEVRELLDVMARPNRFNSSCGTGEPSSAYTYRPPCNVM